MLDDSNGNSITNNTCLSGGITQQDAHGISLVCSNNNRISNNTCTNNYLGISLFYSNNNRISNNICTNNGYGILIDQNNNNIYLNNFANNTYNGYSYESINTWNTPEITYTYGRRTYTRCLGNHWGGYTGIDADGDGIGDTPYQIDGDSDMYPLMKPWENYFAPSEPEIATSEPPSEIAPSERQSKIIYFILRWILED